MQPSDKPSADPQDRPGHPGSRVADEPSIEGTPEGPVVAPGAGAAGPRPPSGPQPEAARDQPRSGGERSAAGSNYGDWHPDRPSDGGASGQEPPQVEQDPAKPGP